MMDPHAQIIVDAKVAELEAELAKLRRLVAPVQALVATLEAQAQELQDCGIAYIPEWNALVAAMTCVSASKSEGETSYDEVVRRIREGTFYEDYDWAAGPALRVLDEITAAYDNASRGPWKDGLEGEYDGGIFTDEPQIINCIADTMSPEDAKLVVLLKNNYPAIREQLLLMEAKLEAIKLLLARPRPVVKGHTVKF